MKSERTHCAQILSFHQWCKYCELKPGTYGLKLNNAGNEAKYSCIYVPPQIRSQISYPSLKGHISVAFYEIYEEIGLTFRDFNLQLILLMYTHLLCEASTPRSAEATGMCPSSQLFNKRYLLQQNQIFYHISDRKKIPMFLMSYLLSLDKT